MLENYIIRSKKGYSLVELLIVMAMVGILAVISAPRYSDFIARGNVRKAANDLLQNARLTSTMAIKENRNYVIAFDIASNSYSIGFDTNGDGVPEGYGVGSEIDSDGDAVLDAAAVRVVDLQTVYGSNISFGTIAANLPGAREDCPACIGYTTPVNFGTGIVREIFLPDGSFASTGFVIINHSSKRYSYIVGFPSLSGKLDLWVWDGDIDNPSPSGSNECTNPPIKQCGWTEIR